MWARSDFQQSIQTLTPQFSAKARGKTSSASANFFTEYCSKPGKVYREFDILNVAIGIHKNEQLCRILTPP